MGAFRGVEEKEEGKEGRKGGYEKGKKTGKGRNGRAGKGREETPPQSVPPPIILYPPLHIT